MDNIREISDSELTEIYSLLPKESLIKILLDKRKEYKDSLKSIVIPDVKHINYNP